MKTGKVDYTKFNLDTLAPRKEQEQENINEYAILDMLPSDDREKGHKKVNRAMHDWLGLSDYRRRRVRARKYVRGDQWHETVNDPDNPDSVITEETLIKRRGKLALKQNAIAPIVKNLLGQFRSNKTRTMVVPRNQENAEASEMLTNALMAAQDLNHTRELDVQNLREMIQSGMVICKQRYTVWKERDIEDLYQENVNPNRIFFNLNTRDIRGFDISRIGEIIDAPLDDLVSAFARNERDGARIRGYYLNEVLKDALPGTAEGLNANVDDGINFLFPNDPSLCRVIEYWELKAEWRTYEHDYLDGHQRITKRGLADVMKENEERIMEATEQGVPADKVPLIVAKPQYDQFWYCTYLTPNGYVLAEGETPYEHGEHPYTILLHPLIDGEVYGVVEDVIDQQRYINRTISMLDWIIGNSAKGVLMVPEGSVPDSEDPDEWAEKWTRADGVMFYKPNKSGQVPTQVSANSINIGANELLAVQMNLMKEISGVHGAIQGIQPASGTPASRYLMESQHASLNSADLLEVFNWFRKRRDMKSIKVITQFYQERNILVSGIDYADKVVKYDPAVIKSIEWDINLSQSLEAPVFKQVMDEMLFELLRMGGIDIEMYLESTSMPFAQKLLQTIRSKREQQAEIGVDEGALQSELMHEAEQAEAQANPAAMRKIDEHLRQRG